MKKNIYYTIAFVLATLMSNITTTSAQLKVTEFTVDTFDPDSVLMQADPNTKHDLTFNYPLYHLILNDSAVQIISSKFYENAPISGYAFAYLNGTNIEFSDSHINAYKKWQFETPRYFFRLFPNNPSGAFADTSNGYTNYIYSNVNLTSYAGYKGYYYLSAQRNYGMTYNVPSMFKLNTETGQAEASVISDTAFIREYKETSGKIYGNLYDYPCLYVDSDTLKAISAIIDSTDNCQHLYKMFFDINTCKLLGSKEICGINGIIYPLTIQYNIERNSPAKILINERSMKDHCYSPHKIFAKTDDETIVFATVKAARGDTVHGYESNYFNINFIAYYDEKYTAIDSTSENDTLMQVLPRWFVTDTLLTDLCGFDVSIQEVDTIGHHIYVYATSLTYSMTHKYQQHEGTMPKGVLFSLCDSTGEVEKFKTIDGITTQETADITAMGQHCFQVLSDGTILFAGTAFKEPFTLTDTLPKETYKYYIAKYDTAFNLIWEIKSSEVIPYTTYTTGTTKYDPQYVFMSYEFTHATEIKDGILLYGASYDPIQLYFLYVNKPNDSLTVGVIDMQMADNSSLKVNAERGSLDFTCYGSQTGAGSAKVRVCDLLGNEIINSSLQLIDGQTEYVRNNRLVSGVYIISVDNGKMMVNKKFMIK